MNRTLAACTRGMKFLLDANMPRAALLSVRKLGFQADHVRDIGLGDGTDEQICSRAMETDAVLVSRDLDFADIRRFPPQHTQAIVVLRLAACRAFSVRCVVWLKGWLQGAARSQWLFHWQGSKRRRRRSDAQPEGPEALLAHCGAERRKNAIELPEYSSPICAKSASGALAMKVRQAARI